MPCTTSWVARVLLLVGCFGVFESTSLCVAQVGFKLMILLPLPPRTGITWACHYLQIVYAIFEAGDRGGGLSSAPVVCGNRVWGTALKPRCVFWGQGPFSVTAPPAGALKGCGLSA